MRCRRVTQRGVTGFTGAGDGIPLSGGCDGGADREGGVSALEDKLLAQIREAHLPEPAREQVLIPGRCYRCDFVWGEPARVVAEVEGATFVGGRHQFGAGIDKDAEQILALLGWCVLRVSSTHIRNGQAIRSIALALGRPMGLQLRVVNEDEVGA